MVLGQVVGTIWGARQTLGLAGIKLTIVRTISGREVVAADRLGAAVGQTVMVANGSRVRDLVYDGGVPVKTVLIGIVDEVGS